MRKWLHAALVVALAFAPALSHAAEKPFFRIGPASSATQPVDPEPENTTLRFVRTGPVASPLTVGQSVTASFTTAGGTEPHGLSANNLPTGLTLSPSGPRAWTISGQASAPGSFASVLTLSDAAGGSATHSLGTIIVTAPVQSNELTIAPWQPESAMPTTAARDQEISEANGDNFVAYVVSGGQEPYTLTVQNGPALSTYSLSFFGVPGLFFIEGNATPFGEYPNMRLYATDASGKQGSILVPLSVSSQAAPLAFDEARTEDPEETEVAPQVAISAVYAAKGGVQPYQMALVNEAGAIPQVTRLRVSSYDPTEFNLTAALQSPGTYSNLKVRLTDSAGQIVIRDLPTITVNDNGSPHLRIETISDLPTPLDSGDTLPNLPITIAGIEDADYSWVEFVYGTAPEGIEIEEVDASQGQYRIVGYPREAGVYSDITVVAGKSLPSGETKEIYYSMPTVVTTTNVMPPMTIVRQFESRSDWVYDSANGVFGGGEVAGGSGRYAATVVSGSFPPGTEVTTGFSIDGDDNVSFRSRGATPGSYGPIVVRISDGYSTIDFDPVSMVVVSSPISYCSAPSADQLTVRPGSSAEFEGYVSGGAGPFTATITGSAPAALGISVSNPQYYSGNYQYILTMAPTGKADTRNASVLITDSIGQTCSAPISATSYSETDITPDGVGGYAELPLCEASGQAEGFRTEVIDGVTHVYRDVGRFYQALFCIPGGAQMPDDYINAVQPQYYGPDNDDPWRGVPWVVPVGFYQDDGECSDGCSMRVEAIGPDGRRWMSRTYVAVGNPNAPGD